MCIERSVRETRTRPRSLAVGDGVSVSESVSFDGFERILVELEPSITTWEGRLRNAGRLLSRMEVVSTVSLPVGGNLGATPSNQISKSVDHLSLESKSKLWECADGKVGTMASKSNYLWAHRRAFSLMAPSSPGPRPPFVPLGYSSAGTSFVSSDACQVQRLLCIDEYNWWIMDEATVRRFNPRYSIPAYLDPSSRPHRDWSFSESQQFCNAQGVEPHLDHQQSRSHPAIAYGAPLVDDAYHVGWNQSRTQDLRFEFAGTKMKYDNASALTDVRVAFYGGEHGKDAVHWESSFYVENTRNGLILTNGVRDAKSFLPKKLVVSRSPRRSRRKRHVLLSGLTLFALRG